MTEPDSKTTPTPAPAPEPSPEKTFTQAEVDSIIGKRLAKAMKGIPGEEELTAFRAWKEGQQTEKERWDALTRERDESRAALTAAQTELEQYRREKFLAASGIRRNGLCFWKICRAPRAPYTLNGTRLEFPRNGAFDPTKALMIAGDFTQAVYAIRQDVTFDVFDSGVISDADGKVVFNLMQNDMKAIRMVIRLGWDVFNPLNALEEDETQRFPFAVYTPAG